MPVPPPGGPGPRRRRALQQLQPAVPELLGESAQHQGACWDPVLWVSALAKGPCAGGAPVPHSGHASPSWEAPDEQAAGATPRAALMLGGSLSVSDVGEGPGWAQGTRGVPGGRGQGDSTSFFEVSYVGMWPPCVVAGAGSHPWSLTPDRVPSQRLLITSREFSDGGVHRARTSWWERGEG